MHPYTVHTSAGPLRVCATSTAHAWLQARELAPAVTIQRIEREGDW